jgi:hypothetical protein
LDGEDKLTLMKAALIKDLTAGKARERWSDPVALLAAIGFSAIYLLFAIGVVAQARALHGGFTRRAYPVS